MTWLLRPGVGLARRDADHLQLGTDPPLAAVLPDTRAVRLLLVELAHGSPLTTLDASTAPVLDALVAAGLVVAADEVAAATRPPRRLPGPGRRARRRPPGVAAAGGRDRPPARPLNRGGVGGAGLDRGRATTRAARRLDAVRHAAPRGPGRSRRPAARSLRRPGRHRLPALRRRPSRRARPSAGVAGRAGRHHATAAAVGARPGPARPGPRVGGARPRHRRGGRSAGHVVGHRGAGRSSRRPSRRTAATSTAAAPGPRTSSTRLPPARPRSGELTSPVLAVELALHRRAGARANSSRSRSWTARSRPRCST